MPSPVLTDVSAPSTPPTDRPGIIGPGPTVIEVRGIGKEYRLGAVTTRTLREDFESRWARFRGRVADTTTHGERVWALREVSFDVTGGQALGIIGKNGAGKSTLLKILSRVTAPTTGTIRARGRIASLLEVGTGFHPELTGRENIFLNGAILGMSHREIRQKLDEIIDFSGVARYIDTPVKRYSSGMYVRLAFAVAAHLESEILIMDEVLAVGDAEFQKKCLGKMNDVARNEGRTVLFVSHNMAAVSQLCQRALMLKQGQILRYGPVAEVVDEYLQTNGPEALEGTPEGAILRRASLERIREVREGATPGQLITCAFEVDCPEPGLAIDLALRHRETTLATASSAYHSPVRLGMGPQRVICELGPLNLHLGNYQLDVLITRPKERVIESYEAALRFDIESQVVDNHYHAQFPAGKHGYFVPPQRWEARESHTSDDIGSRA